MKKHLTTLTMALLAILFLNQSFSQNLGVCGFGLGTAAPSDPSRGANCSNTSTAYITKYRTPQYWVPNNSTPIKTILVNYIVCQDNIGNNAWKDSPTFRAEVAQMFVEINNRYSNVQPRGYTLTCPPVMTPITDTRIRFELNQIIFIKNSAFNNSCSFSAGNTIDDYVYANYPSSRIAMNHIFTQPDSPTGDGCPYWGFYQANNGRSFVLTARSMFWDWHVVWADHINHIAHEYGHAVGLHHTYDGEETQISNFDFLDDVFGTCSEPSMSNAGNPCFANCSSGGPCVCTPIAGSVCYLQGCFFGTNPGAPLMSGTSNPTYISPKLAGRMHRALSLINNDFVVYTNTPMHQYVKEKYSYSVPLNITSSEIWDFAIQMYQDIVVKSGAILTITCEVRMPIDGKIIVESGGQLVVDGGVITSAWSSMWTGIVLNAGSTLLVKNSATIENAKLAIDSKGGASFIVQDSKLNKNYRGIYMETFAGSHPGVIKNSKICCVDASNNAINLPLSPYIGVRAYSGIEISNVTQSNIGVDAAGQTNTFDNLAFGIINTNSSTTVYNNNFTRINYIRLWDGTGRCLHSVNAAPPAAKRTLIVGGSGGNGYRKNTFTNSYLGVFATVNQDVSLLYNTFNNMAHSAGYMYYVASPGNVVSILNNTIDDCAVGLYATGSAGSSELYINNNNINLATPTSNSKPNSVAITITNSSPGTVPTFNVLNNTIKRVTKGIEVTNHNAPNIRSNTITALSDLGSSISTHGIIITASPTADIESNLVKGPSSASQNSWWMNGIRLESCANSKVLYNGVEDIGRGLFFGGSCAGTQTARNNMKNNNDGFVLNYGIVDYQLGSSSACQSSENTWNGTVPSGGSNILSYFSDGTQSPFNLLCTTCTGYTSDMKTPGSIVRVPSGIGAVIVPAYTCNTSSGYTGVHRNMENTDRDQLKRLAKDQINFPAFDASAKWWAKYNLYNTIQTKPELLDEAELKTFADNARTGNLGKLYKLNESLNKGDLKTAVSSTNSFSTTNAIEQNLKDVYAITIANRTSNTLSGSDIKALQKIAKLCPYESGPAVYNARVLLSTVDNTVYENVCENVPSGKGMGRSMEEQTNLAVEETKGIAVYPNPTNDKLNVTIHLQKGETGTLLMYDITGKQVLSVVLNENTDLHEINTAVLSEGLYVYKLNINNSNVKSGKLSIIR